MSRPVTLRHRLEYAGFRLLKAGLTVLPESVALGIGEALGWIAGRLVGVRRRVLRSGAVAAALVMRWLHAAPSERRS